MLKSSVDSNVIYLIDRPTTDELETLQSIAYVSKGRWEVISTGHIERCIDKGWAYRTPENRLRLTLSGREILRRDMDSRKRKKFSFPWSEQ